MRLYYFDAVYVDGQWTRHWYGAFSDAVKGRADYLKLMDCEDDDTELCGQRGDATLIESVDVRCSKAGLLALLQSHGDANN